MTPAMVWQENPFYSGRVSARVSGFDATTADHVRTYHKSWPGYQPTPLRSLAHLARRWGVGGLVIKDESARWGLQAFKGLGGTYAIGRYLSTYFGLSGVGDYPTLYALRDTRPAVVFATATDGNHGVGVAWAATQLGHQARVFMPRGSAAARIAAIRAVGGQVTVTDWDYDTTVAWVAEEALRQHWVLTQDTVGLGDPAIPRWIMQGYLTLMAEIFTPDSGVGLDPPTHIFLQAGVGSFAAAMTGYLMQRDLGAQRPQIVIVEPFQAAPFFRSAQIGDQHLYSAEGPLETIMAGLACGVANPAAWDILKPAAAGVIACGDAVAARGMRILGQPLAGDPEVIAGESGAVPLGVLSIVMEDPAYVSLRQKLRLDAEAQILLVNTEGMTDPVGYRHILWDGWYPYAEDGHDA